MASPCSPESLNHPRRPPSPDQMLALTRPVKQRAVPSSIAVSNMSSRTAGAGVRQRNEVSA